MKMLLSIGDLIKDNFANVQTGPFGTQLKASEYVESGIPVINVRNIGLGILKEEKLEFLLKHKAEQLKSHYLLEGDIVFARKGAVERHLYVTEKEEGWIQGSDCIRLRISNSDISSKYLSYCFRTQDHQDWMNNLCSFGATMTSLNQNIISKIKISLPSLDKQLRVVDLLFAYDKSIDFNTQQIKLLEETSRELYKEWFVRMRFPGYKKTKFSKGIPTGWKITPIGEVIDYHIGGGWGNDVPDDYFNTSGYVIRGTDIPGIKLGTANRDVYRFHKASNMKSRELLKGDIVFETAGGSEGQPLGRTCFITQELLDAYGDKVMAASFCKQIRTSSIPSLYLYYFLNYLYDSGLIEAFQTQSTGISNYQFGPFLKFQQIILPNGNLMQEFHDIAITIQKQIAILGQQNTELRQTRDRLLPRLISGKLQVKPHNGFNKTENTESHQVRNTIEKSTEDAKVKSNLFFQRRVLAAHIIDRLKDEPTFGHVKLMKLMYLCEHLAEIETASHYHRDAAGPYDNRMIRSIDSQLKKAQWFECKKTGSKYQYTTLPKKEEYKNWFTNYYSDKEAGIENLLHIFGKEKTEKAEMVATLYEAWRDLKDKKQLPTRQAIIYEVLNNWHESKQRISEERWLKCLQWMKEKNWIT